MHDAVRLKIVSSDVSRASDKVDKMVDDMDEERSDIGRWLICGTSLVRECV